MAPPSKKVKLTKSSTVISKTKNNPGKPSKTVTRSRSKEIVIEQQLLGAKPVKVDMKAGSHSKDTKIDQHLSGKTVKPCKSPSKSKSIVSDPSSLSKSSRMVQTEKPITKGKCTQCAVKDEKLKQSEKTTKNLRTRNASLKQQVSVLEDCKKSIETPSTSVDLTSTAEINLDKLMEAKINPKLIESELIRRNIPRNNDIWLTFGSLVESEEEKIKKQKTTEEYYKYLKEKQLIQEEIAKLHRVTESVNNEHREKVNMKNIKKLKKDINDLNTDMIDNEFSFSEKIFKNEEECKDIVQKQIPERGVVLDKAQELNEDARKKYCRLVRYRNDNPLPPCEICANQEAESKKYENLCCESRRNWRQMKSKYKNIRKDMWAGEILKGGLEAGLKFVRQKIHGTKCINGNDPCLLNMGTGIIENAKRKYDEQIIYLEKRHCENYEVTGSLFADDREQRKTSKVKFGTLPKSSEINLLE